MTEELEVIKRCVACRKEKPVSQMKVCMHAQMHNYVCDSKCMNDFYNPPKKPAQLPSQGEEAVEVVAYIDDGGALYTSKLLEIMSVEPDGCEPLMAVAQHQRILAASAGSDEPIAWREHSVNYAKGEKCPETIETLQAAWDRDQELINDMRHEIARHKTRINRLEQRRPADQVADGVVVPVQLLKIIEQSWRIPSGCPKSVSEEVGEIISNGLAELRALLAKSEGVKK